MSAGNAEGRPWRPTTIVTTKTVSIRQVLERDKKVTQDLEIRGWTVLRFWECDIKKQNVDLTPLAD